MFEAVVFFAGPQTVWARAPQPGEILARFESRFKSIAQARAMTLHRRLDARLCGWVLQGPDGARIDCVDATDPMVKSL